MISSFLPWRPEMLTLNICFLCNKNNVTARNLKGPQRWWMEPGVEEGGDKKMSDTPNLRWKIQPLGSWQTLSIVRQEQHGRNRLRFKLWVMAFNLLRALLILQLQVATGRLHGEGAVVVILGAPDDRWEQTIGTDEHLKIYNSAEHQQTGQVISTQNTQRNVHILCSHLAQKNDRLSVFVKKFLSTEIDLSSPYNNCHPRTGAICDFSQDLWSEDKAYWQ